MKENAKEKIIILTDIHGCLEEMNTLLSKVEFDEMADMLIILGDTMDRGRDSYGVYLRLMTLAGSTVSVRGWLWAYIKAGNSA